MTDAYSFDLARFEQLLDVHGADLARWPEELRSPASELLASSAVAQLAWSRAEQVEALLDAVPDLLPSAELSARIAALPARHRQGWAAWWPFGNPLAPLLAWGAAAAFGIFIGSGLVPGLEPVAEVASFSSAGELVGVPASSESAGGDWIHSDAESSDSAASDSAASDSTAGGFAGSDSVEGDDAQSDDWIDLELALGLGPEWEEEP